MWNNEETVANNGVTVLVYHMPHPEWIHLVFWLLPPHLSLTRINEGDPKWQAVLDEKNEGCIS